MQNEIEQLKTEIKLFESLASQAAENLRRKRSQLVELLSRQWIEANGVTREQVQFSRGEGMPYFLMATEFAAWLGKQPNRKRFVEWNGVLMFTEEFIARGLWVATPGRVEHLPGEEKNDE